MFYIKIQLGESLELKLPITEHVIYYDCEQCGKELPLSPESMFLLWSLMGDEEVMSKGYCADCAGSHIKEVNDDSHEEI